MPQPRRVLLAPSALGSVLILQDLAWQLLSRKPSLFPQGGYIPFAPSGPRQAPVRPPSGPRQAPRRIPRLLLSHTGPTEQNTHAAQHPLPASSPVLLADHLAPSRRCGKGVPSSGRTRSCAPGGVEALPSGGAQTGFGSHSSSRSCTLGSEQLPRP